MPKTNAPATAAYTLRLTKEDKEWLDETARTCGIEVPALVRHAIESLRQYVRENGGKLITPIDIREFWEVIQSHKDSKARASAPLHVVTPLAIAAEGQPTSPPEILPEDLTPLDPANKKKVTYRGQRKNSRAAGKHQEPDGF